MDKVFYKLESLGDKLKDSDGVCSGDLLCTKSRWHKCDYRPVAITTYVKGIKQA